MRVGGRTKARKFTRFFEGAKKRRRMEARKRAPPLGPHPSAGRKDGAGTGLVLSNEMAANMARQGWENLTVL